MTVLLHGHTSGRVRKLGGFAKHHHEPDSLNTAAQGFIQKVGTADVQRLAEGLHRDIRTLFNYKRKDFDYSCEDGTAAIKTPDFDVELRIHQSTDDPKSFVLTTEVTQLHTDSIASDERFHSCFNHHCDRLIIYFSQAIDLDHKIDQIEEIESLAGCLDYAPDASELELRLPALDLRIHVTSTAMTFQLLTLPNLGKLLDHSQQAFEILTAAGFGLKLTA